MSHYLRVFNFLWRAKRMEYTLTDIWKGQMCNAKLLKTMPGTNTHTHISFKFYHCFPKHFVFIQVMSLPFCYKNSTLYVCLVLNPTNFPTVVILAPHLKNTFMYLFTFLPSRAIRRAASVSHPGVRDGPLHPPDAVLHHLRGQAISGAAILLGCKTPMKPELL